MIKAQNLTSRIPPIRKDSLARNPRPLRAQEPHDRCNVLDHGQTPAHAVRLVVLDGFGGFLWVEKGWSLAVSYKGLVGVGRKDERERERVGSTHVYPLSPERRCLRSRGGNGVLCTRL
jgi:hypothetical protein